MTVTTRHQVLDYPVRTGLGQWQKTPAQIAAADIEAKVREYADALARLHAAQVRLYEALLATDETAAEYAAADIAAAVRDLPAMPDWPDTDEELIARLRGQFAPARPVSPVVSKHLERTGQ